ncbi:hypothetical protein GE09DRAFT_1087930 [Coniochaeta sp. 2T2.1]|nr:hypothetical protein GE09DRAFT_1087930 [Coniochaeta sp. 2T2.1]
MMREDASVDRLMFEGTPTSSAGQYALSLSQDELNEYSHNREKWYRQRFAYPPDNPLIFVKWGGPDIHAEGDMQKLAWDWLEQERARTKCNIYIPEVYKIFRYKRRTFLLMQFVKATPIRWLFDGEDPFWLDHEDECDDIMAEAIELLSRMPVPGDATVGRYSSARTYFKHPIFKHHEACLIYKDVQEMEDHFNRVAIIRFGMRPPPEIMTVNFRDEPLVYCYSDLQDENFLFEKDDNGRPRLWLVDFEHAAFLPISFLSHAVVRNRWYTTQPIQDRLTTLPQHNLPVMFGIQDIFGIAASNIGFTQEQRDELRRANVRHDIRT